MAIKSFKNMAKFKYFMITVSNENEIHEEIKGKLNSMNACYISCRNLLSSHLLSKKYTQSYNFAYFVWV
jgi:hypothetical protein